MCTIRPQTIMLADNMRVEFAEEKHGENGEHVLALCTITKDALSYKLRFDPRGDLVFASTTPAPLPTSADSFNNRAVTFTLDAGER